MITEALINMLLGVFNFFVGLLPSWGPDITALYASAGSLGAWFHHANGWFPLNLTLICLGIIVTYQVGAFAWRIVLFIWEVLPFKAT